MSALAGNSGATKSAPVPAAEVSHFMDTFAAALMRGPVRTINAQPLNDRGGSAGLHGCEAMEALIARRRHKIEAVVETISLPDGALIGLVTTMTADTREALIEELARLRDELRATTTKGEVQ